MRPEGREQVDLVEVQAGLHVNVTPHLITEPKRTRVEVPVDSDDGTFGPRGRVDEPRIVPEAPLRSQGIVVGFRSERRHLGISRSSRWTGLVPRSRLRSVE